MCEGYYVDVLVHGADVPVHGADVRVHSAVFVRGADVRGRREVLVWSLIPVGLCCIPTERVS